MRDPVGTIEIPISEAVARITMTVRATGVKWWNVRARIGVRLIILGSKVMGIKHEVEFK